ncbi:ATP-binding protein [Azospirillum rugosum]|uniref:histidine kinase n=1 Tax=Azospirillum rugosum TaxID=416170 RepID=A0ABS4ST93_9PROT|nr:ATP-binding protein [Azospirillum rugosum]MBP2295662.1 PAS domain S-box-containing protein [Azospirillum rugosum]MDQ0529448.1 PAS domain S-box-containing protein [Azospirillum rugosum]
MRLHTMTMLTALATGALMIGLVLAVGGAFQRVLDLAGEAEDAIVPRITRQQEYAVFAARMGQLAEAVLRSHAAQDRARALDEAQALANRFATATDPVLQSRLDQALQALRRTADRANGIDAKAAAVARLRARGSEAYRRLLHAGAPLSVQEPVFHVLEVMGDAAVTPDPARVDELNQRFRSHAVAVLEALPRLRPDDREPLLSIVPELEALGGVFALRREMLSDQAMMGLDTEIAHGVLNDLSEGLTADAATGTQRMAETLTAQAESGLLIVVIGLGTASAVQLLLYMLLRIHVVRPIRRASEALSTVQQERRAVRLKPALFAELQAIATSVERFGEALVETHEYAAALKAGEERMRAILAASPFPIVIARVTDGSVLYFNPQAETLFGTHGARLTLTRDARFFVHPPDADRLAHMVAERGAVGDLEVRMRTADGRPFWAMISAVEIRDEDEAAILVAVNDITFRKRSEEETEAAKQRAERALLELRETQQNLIQAEKMASLGGLVAGVAHEVNTPVGIALTGITHLADQTRRIARGAEENTLRRADFTGYLTMATEACRLIEGNLNRAVELIQSFKQTAVDQTSEERRTVDLRRYLDDVLASLHPRLKQTRHRVVVDCPEGLSVDSYPGALFQALTNLVMNAVTHAYPEDGSGTPKAGTLDIAVTRPNAAEVELRFSDDGCGIPADHLGRIFDPFFTTRRGKGGSGLGLHIVYNIVNTRLKGSIRVESEAGRGTSFVLRFPVTVAAESTPAEPAAERAPEPAALP